MKELIKISVNNNRQTLSARDLHEFLEVKSEFRNWITNYIKDFDFVEGKDFVKGGKILPSGQKAIEYEITIEMAKELAMLSRSEKGKQARQYFIACEIKLKEIATNQPKLTLSQMLIEAGKQLAEKDKQIQRLEPKANFYHAVADSKDLLSIEEVAKIVGEKGVGRNNFFKLLRKRNILKPDNVPYQRFVDRGYFALREYSFTDRKGQKRVGLQTKVYQKGLEFLLTLTKKDGGISHTPTSNTMSVSA